MMFWIQTSQLVLGSNSFRQKPEMEAILKLYSGVLIEHEISEIKPV
jgi:hypothetical protein